jgi:hypothetical protein
VRLGDRLCHIIRSKAVKSLDMINSGAVAAAVAAVVNPGANRDSEPETDLDALEGCWPRRLTVRNDSGVTTGHSR